MAAAAKKAEAGKSGRANLREPILDAALAILRSEGVRGVTQSRVARAAGMPQGHLTYYFPRRSDLLVAVARRSVELVARDVQTYLAGKEWAAAGADAKQKASALLMFLLRDRERTRMLVGLLVESEDDTLLRQTMLDNLQLMRGVIAAAMGRDPADPVVELTIATLWGVGIQLMLWGDKRAVAETDRVLAALPEFLDRIGGMTRSGT